ncbi:MAG: UDP-N-acetylmuramoyl-tripeptide--D-alanyl-D-alanine ligase [Paludibacteraceae bacterium]|nr:UDP-N-acetylmuramoyl-tripeptide--D-alanyl-D-alanine ligase [Paludibacteraceae bacterium]
MDWNFLIRNKESLTVTTDSRRVTPGCVFVALKGEHFDGNDFVAQAEKDGAAYVIKGENALRDLQDLARAWRRELGLPIIGITGTNGKTTTKELLAAVLATRYCIHYTQGNLNNSLGVPLTLLQCTRAHEMAIVEMGASHPGDIRELVEIAEPNYGLITNVGRAHLQGFGSFEGVMRTKAELYDFLLAHGGTIFINADNPHLKEMLEAAQKNVNCQLSIVNYHSGEMPDGTHLVGEYNAENIQAALCVGEYFGISREQGLQAIRAYVPTNNRSQHTVTERNDLVIDAYNANPTSMQAAIHAFATAPANGQQPTCYILGAMRELGDYTRLEHQNLVNDLLVRKADRVLLVGPEYRDTTAPYPIFDDVDALIGHLQLNPLNGYRILIKGSRSNQLEKIIPLL